MIAVANTGPLGLCISGMVLLAVCCPPEPILIAIASGNQMIDWARAIRTLEAFWEMSTIFGVFDRASICDNGFRGGGAGTEAVERDEGLMLFEALEENATDA
jgi:hypothetical protein